MTNEDQRLDDAVYGDNGHGARIRSRLGERPTP